MGADDKKKKKKNVKIEDLPAKPVSSDKARAAKGGMMTGTRFFAATPTPTPTPSKTTRSTDMTTPSDGDADEG